MYYYNVFICKALEGGRHCTNKGFMGMELDGHLVMDASCIACVAL
jgi:hypothetical protein